MKTVFLSACLVFGLFLGFVAIVLSFEAIRRVKDLEYKLGQRTKGGNKKRNLWNLKDKSK